MLVVEDDDAIAAGLVKGLQREGFEPVRAGNAAQALNSLPADFILLDLGLPDRDGLELFHNLRAVSAAPIIMVTARGAEEDRIAGLDLGADDYVVKPFALGELVARMNAVLRRTGGKELGGAPLQVINGIEIDRRTRSVHVDGCRDPVHPEGVRHLGVPRPRPRRGDHSTRVAGRCVGTALVRIDQDDGRPRRVVASKARIERRDRDAARRRVPDRGGPVRNRLLAGFILFSILTTSILLVPIGFTLENHENANTLIALKHDAAAFSTLLVNDLSHNRVEEAIDLARSYAHSTGRQILATDQAGVLIATKSAQSKDKTLLNIAQTVGSAEVDGVTGGATVGGSQYYVAMQLPHATNPSGSINHVVLVVTYPVKVVARTIHSDWRNLALYGLLILFAACLFGLVVSDSLARPLRRIGGAVEAIGSGQLDVRAPVTVGPIELRRLAESINATAARLIALLEAQRAFVEDASHQLRTPLTALQLHLENLQHSEGGADDLAAVLAEVGSIERARRFPARAREERIAQTLFSRHRPSASCPRTGRVLEALRRGAPGATQRQRRPGRSRSSRSTGSWSRYSTISCRTRSTRRPRGARFASRSNRSLDVVEVHVIDNGLGARTPRTRVGATKVLEGTRQ